MNKLTNEDIENLIENILKELPKRLSIVFGKKMRFGKVSKRNKQKAARKFKQAIDIQQEIEKIKSKQLGPKEEPSRLSNLLDRGLRIYVPGIPKKCHALDWSIQFLQKGVQIPKDISYLRNTKFFEYQEALRNLFLKIYTLEHRDKLAKFLESVYETDDMLALAQSMITRVFKHYEYLEKNKKRLTRKVMEKYVSIYGDLSGHFEKHIRIIMGMLNILEKGKTPDYQHIKNAPLGYNLRKVLSVKDYRIFGAPFNKTIRNAISHESYVFYVSEEQIEFVDLRTKSKLRYLDFIKEIRELSSLVFVLSQFRLLQALWKMEMVKKSLER